MNRQVRRANRTCIQNPIRITATKTNEHQNMLNMYSTQETYRAIDQIFEISHIEEKGQSINEIKRFHIDRKSVND
jgi:hypothetical protein